MGVVQVQEKPYKHFHTRHQYFATFAANLLAFAHGAIIGWVSPALPILASDETPLLSGPLTAIEISWIGSINCIGGLLGALTFGYITTLMGCKRVVLLLAAPIITFWLLIYFGIMYHHILIARFIAGWTGGGVQSTTILFVSEISNDDIRGRLGSVTLFMRNIGTLLAYVLGASVEYEYIPCICILIPIVFVIIFMMLPNTPQYYLQRGQNQKAENALKFYKGYKGNNQQEDNAIVKEFERLKMISNDSKKDEKLQLADFCNRDAMKAIGFGIALTTFSIFTATFTITSYAVMTFAKAGTSMDPYISSVMLAVALIFGSLTTTYFADKLGRKKLNLISLMGSACGLFITAIFHYVTLNGYDLSEFAWIPVVCLSFVVFISSSGIIPLAIVCSVEYLPTKIRTYGIAIICSMLSSIAFISLKLYPILLESIDLHGCLSIYGTGCIFGFFFILLTLTETSGKSLDGTGLNEKHTNEPAREVKTSIC